MAYLVNPKRVRVGTPNREPQEYSRNIIEYKDPGYIPVIYSYYILRVPCLGFPVKSLPSPSRVLGTAEAEARTLSSWGAAGLNRQSAACTGHGFQDVGGLLRTSKQSEEP